MWQILKETPLEDKVIELDVAIHSPCCHGQIFKYYLQPDGRIFNHQLIEVGEGAYISLENAREEYERQAKTIDRHPHSSCPRDSQGRPVV